MKLSSIACCLLCAAAAANGSDFQQKVFQPRQREKHVAIIGGGAAGTSAAYWLKNAFPNTHGSEWTVSTTLYEQNDYLGGRSTVARVGDVEMELGASIFIDKNYNLMNATQRFGLQLKKQRDEEVSGRFGIWDGESFLFEESGNDYWDAVKVIWRYGLSPIQFRKYLQGVIDTFTQTVYDAEASSFYDIQSAAEQFGLASLVNTTAAELLEDYNVRFVQEIIQTATRANYGQDTRILHGFGALVSMAAQGASSVKGGNFRIFEAFAERSGASIQLNSQVTSVYNVTETDDNGEPVRRYVVSTKDGDSQAYDAVIIATPLHLANLDMPFHTASEAVRDYHTVHVTLIKGVPKPGYFGRKSTDVPLAIVTTGHPLTQRFEDGIPPFTTFTVHYVFPETGQSVVKMFSSEPLTDEFLSELFYNWSDIHRKTWQAFPRLHPVKEPSAWPPVILDGFEDHSDNSGVIYVNAFESLISTMETQTVASKNAVRILRDQWCTSAKSCVPFGDGWGQ